MNWIALVLAALLCATFAYCDLPVHCMPDGTPGQWTFELSDQTLTKDVVHTCGLRDAVKVTKTLNVTITAPDVAKDSLGHVGNWHNVYDQGFEVVIGGNKYFAFFNYTDGNGQVTSNCGKTFTGWFHEVGVAPKSWGCYRASKVGQAPVTTYFTPQDNKVDTYINNNVDVVAINKQQNLWKATEYKDHSRFGLVPLRKLKPLMASRQNVDSSVVPADLPKSLDWRNMSGVNYVSPVRNQGACGSCFSFASTALIEARIRIATQNAKKPIFAPQDIMGCCAYSQACDGGFPYLVFKYGEDFGLREEHCFPYEARDGNCKDDRCPATEPRQFVTDYQYIGGYVGNSNEQNMLEAIQKGPIVLNFLVYADFSAYRGGIYVRTSERIRGGHSVLGVGYGEENGVKFWIVKNSWGESWGEHGFFRIRRGTDECIIESMGPSFATPVL